ncbi:MAG: aryl-sulfate sulfotransferase [Parafilimonas sp.]
MKYFSHCIIIFLAVLLNACQKEYDPLPANQISISNEQIILNPNGDAPLTASISLTTSEQTKISLRVVGKNGAESDILKDFDDVNTVHSIPVLGLYPDYNNTVEINFKNASGIIIGTKTYSVKTAVLPPDIFPAITINTKQPGIEPGLTLVSYFGQSLTSSVPQYPFMFDAFGDIRWYFDFRNSAALNNLFYDVGMERLQNGDLYFGNTNSGTIYEADMQGKIIDTWPLPGYIFHHNVQEKANGNFLVTVGKENASTVEDYIVEVDRQSKQIIRTWDLHQSLQYNRRTLSNDPVDWIHVNAVIYDASDSSIIISGRVQGLIKLDQNNNVVWIMGCHAGWGVAGNGTDLNQYLLQPLDKNNQPITDNSILNGNTNSPDFEWNWYQHAPMLKPDGHIMLFDNGGDNRNFSGSGQYSRAVEYNIDKNNKTVRQVWEYGKERGAETYSSIVSDVDFLNDDNHVIFSSGAVNNTTTYGKVVEVDYTTQAVLFEATITPPKALYGITFHRTERMSLYP